ncbi:MAG: CoA pyrophosphatase, partial [Caldimonas sp.]
MALGFDPEKLPVLGLDSHLPAVASANFSPAAIRRRFGAPPAWEPEIKVERRFSQRRSTPASVL